MKLLGLTGGIGMGKSTAVEILRAEGCQVVDTDVIGRELVKPGEPALKEIERTFGASYVGPGGELRRRDLAELVFSNSKAKQELESILHPRIRAATVRAHDPSGPGGMGRAHVRGLRRDRF